MYTSFSYLLPPLSTGLLAGVYSMLTVSPAEGKTQKWVSWIRHLTASDGVAPVFEHWVEYPWPRKVVKGVFNKFPDFFCTAI